MFGKEGVPPVRTESRVAAGASSVSEGTALSVIASGMRIVGDVESSGVIKVDGRIDGSVTQARQVLLGRGATIKGSIIAEEVVIGGTVEGGIRASERLELQASALVNGDIETKSIVVLEGARINGAVRMSDLASGRGDTQRSVVTETLRMVTGA